MSAAGPPQRANTLPLAGQRSGDRRKRGGGPPTVAPAQPAAAGDPPPWLLTLRLALTEITRHHANELYELDADPRVMRYIGSGRVSSRQQIDDAMRRLPRAYAHYPGLGTWRATRRDNGDFVGWFALKYIPRTAEVEVGYRLRYGAWGQGFATEGARELVRYGFDDLGLYRIVGITHPENTASQRVLRKIGLVDIGWGRYYGRAVRVYETVREAAWRPAWREGGPA